MDEENKLNADELKKMKQIKDEYDKINKEARDKSLWLNTDDNTITDIIDSFTEYSDEMDINWEKFDYRTFDADYYRKRFPKFDEKIIDILVRCSNSKLYDDTRLLPVKEEIKDEDFEVDFS